MKNYGSFICSSRAAMVSISVLIINTCSGKHSQPAHGIWTRLSSVGVPIEVQKTEQVLWFDMSKATTARTSIWIVRYGVICSHIFLFMTIAALALASLHMFSSPGVWLIPNLIFNGIYTVCYASFLVLYYVYDSPSPTFVIGVALYFVGYALFFLLFALLMLENKSTVSIFYVSASVSFTIGSVVLVHATVPLDMQGLKRFNPFRKISSLFWGSCFFFTGSLAFTVDSTLPLLLISLDSNVSFSLILTGLAAFAVGRGFFLHGSTTEECDMFFRNRCKMQAED